MSTQSRVKTFKLTPIFTIDWKKLKSQKTIRDDGAEWINSIPRDAHTPDDDDNQQ